MKERKYKCIDAAVWQRDNYQLTVIRDEDKYAILKWRNEQINILRQKRPIAAEEQESYFKKVVDSLFDVDEPQQLLFSFFENEQLIGYGGLVHIDWESKNAEISFLLETLRTTQREYFIPDFTNFIYLVTGIAFDELNFFKIHTTYYDIEERQFYKEVIYKMGFVNEAALYNHISINNRYHNVIIASCFNNKLNADRLAR